LDERHKGRLVECPASFMMKYMLRVVVKNGFVNTMDAKN